MSNVTNSGYVDHKKSDTDAKDNLNYEGPAKEFDQEYVMATHLDPARQVDTHGVYLDDVQRTEQELIRARVEGRKPDLKNPPKTAGDVILTTATARKFLPSDTLIPAEIVFTNKVVIGNEPADEPAELKSAPADEKTELKSAPES